MNELIPEKVTLGRNKMTPLFKTLVLLLFGLGMLGVTFFNNVSPGLAVVMSVVSGIIIGLSVYGFFSILASWKRTKSVQGTINEMEKTINDALK